MELPSKQHPFLLKILAEPAAVPSLQMYFTLEKDVYKRQVETDTPANFATSLIVIVLPPLYLSILHNFIFQFFVDVYKRQVYRNRLHKADRCSSWRLHNFLSVHS